MFNTLVRITTLVLIAQGVVGGGLWAANIMGVTAPTPRICYGDPNDIDCWGD